MQGIKVVGFNENKPNAYIGDWKKRKRLICEKRHRVGQFYVKEPLAYLRQFGTYVKEDRIWVYVGKSGAKYIWYEVPFYILRSYLYFENRYDVIISHLKDESCVKKHEVTRQYTDMIKCTVTVEGYRIQLN
jgi:hypothetical protein